VMQRSSSYLSALGAAVPVCPPSPPCVLMTDNEKDCIRSAQVDGTSEVFG
jgi:hypothetical protein